MDKFFTAISFYICVIVSHVNHVNACSLRPQIDALYDQASADPVAFWEQCAYKVHWFNKWDNVLTWNPPYSRWFENGSLNVSYNCLDRHLPNNKDKTALIWCSENGEERRVSYLELHKEVCQLANTLKQLGVKKGDCVVIYMPMVPEAIASMLACARIGAMHSVVFGGTGSGALRERINDAKAHLLITANESYRRGKKIPFKEACDQILDECPSLEKVIVLKRTDQHVNMKQGRDFWYHDLVPMASSDCPCESMDAEDLLFVLYTSGTTGKSKGIIHSTGGYLVGVHNTFEWVFNPAPQDVYWCTADIGWITGHSYVVYGPMSNGITQVIYDGAFDYPKKDQAWKIIDKYGVTIFYTAPTLIRTFMKWGEKDLNHYRLGSLRLLGSIGEPLNPEAWRWFYTHVGKENCFIVDTWFQTETGAFVLAPIPDFSSPVPGSVSKPLPGYEVSILDDSGKDVKSGSLAIMTPYPSMLRGILNDPDRFVKAYWSKWDKHIYYPGDFAEKDSEGNLWIQGRADEVIKVSGHRIGTAEIENSILQVEGVSESAVVGVTDPTKGNVIVALVILKEECLKQNFEEYVRQMVANDLGSYAKPEIVRFVNELPKTRSGKILRRLIKNLIEGNSMGDVTTLENKSSLESLEKVCEQIRSKLCG